MNFIKKLFKYISVLLLSLISYVIIVTILSYIPVNSSQTDKEKPIAIYILTNGVHTDIVMPAKTEFLNWKQLVLPENTISKDSSANFLAMGWGDKGFYLETPTWADLKASTALKATTGLSTSAIHTTYYNKMKEGVDCKKIQISTENYQKLITYIKESFEFEKDKLIKIDTKLTYGKNDTFYEAKGSYSLFYTCNSWANGALKACNQKAALHTLTDSGIFRHYAK